MQHLIRTLSSLALAILCTAIHAQSVKISTDDLSPIVGFWQGKLTYLDYGTDSRSTISINLRVSPLEGQQGFVFANIYPGEAHANSADTIRISDDGTMLGPEKVVSRAALPSGELALTTEASGTDGNEGRNATFRYSYMIGSSKFSAKKEVQYEGEDTWIERYSAEYNRAE